MAAKPWIGFAVRKAPGKNNLLVQDVAEGGPAANAGIRSGDELDTIDGRKVTDTAAFKGMLKTWNVGQSLTIEIMRDANGVDNAEHKKCTLIIGKKEREVVEDAPPLRSVADIEAILKDSDKLVKCSAVIFNACDADMSGLVTRDEFVATMGPWMQQNLGKPMDKSDLEHAFDEHDKDHSGFMRRSEFTPVTKSALEAFHKKHANSATGAGGGAGGAGGAGKHNAAGAAGAPAKKSWKEKLCCCCPCMKKK